ncbi:MAG: NAD-dependent epimerase/dehydratase family protein [bacterium]|nr:NAD-dependent epimerase/dehydratase family protein [bacterium]
MQTILVTGGAGFVGSNLAIHFKNDILNCRVIALDNLKRRGSELSLNRLKKAGIEFVHGDVRVKEDLLAVGKVDIILDCSAEPSVLAGVSGSPDYVIQTNLVGTLNALELARIHGSSFIFLSTSRVYPIVQINDLTFEETETRFELSKNQKTQGASERGISEDFSLQGARSIYGASKLASELFIKEYVESYGIKAVINRCGVLTGPWQMGKVDQGVIVLWIARHIYGGELSYIGYGGQGKQVRDIMHVDDLCNLVSYQLKNMDLVNSQIFNVGGGRQVSISLCELTELSQRITGKKISIKSIKEDRPNDLRIYLTDCSKVSALSNWRPNISPGQIVEDISKWIIDNKVALEPILT